MRLFEEAMAVVGQYVPPELEADFEILKQVAIQQLEAFEGVDSLDPSEIPPAQRQRIDEAFARLEDPEVVAAIARFEDYFRTTCPDVDFGTGSVDSDPGAAGSATIPD
jgi:hypothetical protein